MKLTIGVDFDNTIVCYDGLFHRLACEQGLITALVPARKEDVRDYLRARGKEDVWTELQGFVYGARMDEAIAFPGVLEFFAEARKRAIDVYVISHKTRYPYRGEQYDLHAAARCWLELNGFFDMCGIGLSPDRVFFEESRFAKVERIVQQRCTHFIDDMPELFQEASFPEKTKRVLFRSERSAPLVADGFAAILSDWHQIADYVWKLAS
jgi:hypothetical protein